MLLDLVPNHTSHLHPFFLDAERGPRSERYDWYDRDADGRPTHYFNWTHLPNLNYDNPEVRAYMDHVFSHWVSEFDVDGVPGRRVLGCAAAAARLLAGMESHAAQAEARRAPDRGGVRARRVLVRQRLRRRVRLDRRSRALGVGGRLRRPDTIAGRLDRALAADPRPGQGAPVPRTTTTPAPGSSPETARSSTGRRRPF